MIESEFQVVRKVVPPEIISDAVRQIHIEVFKYGVSSQEIQEWNKTTCWLPHLSFREPFESIRNAIPKEYTSSIPCGPQIVIVPPENPGEANFDFHVDDVPEWAQQRGLKIFSIVGVALTHMIYENGGLQIESNGCPDLRPGDIIVLHPETRHRRCPNLTEYPRYTFYYRWLINV